jgi:hypothetical protein
VSKLFGVFFGLNLDVEKVDEFLVERIWKKLMFWNMVHLLLVGRLVMANFV